MRGKLFRVNIDKNTEVIRLVNVFSGQIHDISNDF